jgi:hypothetical protein
MERCWASLIGECSGKMSSEHIVTEKLWSDDTIGVRGLPWCSTEHKFIRREAYTSNILCTSHNSKLSPVDQAGIHAFDVFRNARKYGDERVALRQSGIFSGPFELISHTIDGRGLERWFLKTLINIEVVGKQGYPIGPDAQAANVPSKLLVEIAFGLTDWRGRSGLYLPVHERQSVHPQERVTYQSQIRDTATGSYIGGGIFVFYGFHFFLCLEPAGLPDRVQVTDPEGNVVGQLSLLYRPHQLNLEIDNSPSQTINITG